MKTPTEVITPWFLTSEPVEHLWAYLRIGRHSGRRTNLAAADVLHGMRKLNRTLTLDAAQQHLLQPTVSHTRGKTLIPHPEEEVLYYGKDVTISDIKTAIQRGFNQARVKFNNVSGFRSTVRYEDDEEDWCTADEDSEDEQEQEEGVEEDIPRMGDEDLEHPSATALMNDGRSHMMGQSRFRRFSCISNIRLQMDMDCQVNNGSC